MYWAITKKFHSYLIGSNFQVFPNSNPLSKVMTRKKNEVDMSKVVNLSAMNFSIIYRGGKKNRNIGIHAVDTQY